MRWTSRAELGVIAAAALLVPRQAAAQGWRETGIWSVAVFARPAFVGGGLSSSRRDAGRTRLGIAAAAGVAAGAGAAGRVEAVWHFLLDPLRTSGNTLYAGGGIAVAIDHDGTLRPALELLVGVETGPQRPRGAFIEAGVGRGARVALGWRWRKRNAPRR